MDRPHRPARYIARTVKHLDPKIPSITKRDIINFGNTQPDHPRTLTIRDT